MGGSRPSSLLLLALPAVPAAWAPPPPPRPVSALAPASAFGTSLVRYNSRAARTAAWVWPGFGVSGSLVPNEARTLFWRSLAAAASLPSVTMSTTLAVIPGSAPRLSSTRSASTRFCAAAKIRGVCPDSVSNAFTSAPWSRSSATRSALPDAAARCREVTPLFDVLAFTLAPALSSLSTTAVCPPLAATWSGVYWPIRVTALGFAPA